jgi:hypothetical protein
MSELSQAVGFLFADIVSQPRLEPVLAAILRGPPGQLQTLKPLLTSEADLAIDGVDRLSVGWLQFEDDAAADACLFIGYDSSKLETWCAFHNRGYTLRRVPP